MSWIEEECRWSIVQAYACWAIDHGILPVNMVAYMRALGLDF